MARDAADSANEYADNLNSIEPALHSAFVMGAGFVPGPVGALGSGLVDGEITYFETGNVKTALVRGGTTAAVGLAFGKAGKVMGGPLSRFIAGRLSGGAAAAVAGAESKAIASPVLNAIGKTNCFVAGTLVQMADGTTKPIEQVKVGEYVKSRNPQTGATEAKAVTETFQHLAPQVLTLSLTDPRTGTAERITCTPGHPFYVDGKGFVLAGQLGIGTSIVTRAGPALQVTGLTWQKSKAQELVAGSAGSSFGGYTVYNLTVEDDHTFFVGDANGGTWVHNICYTKASRNHVYQHGHAANSPDVINSAGNVVPKSKFYPTEGGEKFTDEVINHPNVNPVVQGNGRTSYTVNDLGRGNVGTNRQGLPTPGGQVIVEGNPSINPVYSPGDVVTQYPY